MDTYEMKYKNALEWARQVMNGETGFIRKEVEEVFPELKESEGERIRQKLIKLVKMSSEVGGFALHKWEADEMLAWLEKQGEKLKKVSIWKHWTGGGIAGGSEYEQIFLIKIGNVYSISSCLGYECDYIELSELDKLMREEKQGKPKWTEGDDGMLDATECWLDTLCEYLKDSSSECIPNVASCINWLKSLKQRMEEQQ